MQLQISFHAKPAFCDIVSPNITLETVDETFSELSFQLHHICSTNYRVIYIHGTIKNINNLGKEIKVDA